MVQLKGQLRDVTLIIIGNAVMALGYAKWMVPHHIINGGVTSIAQIVSHYAPIDIPMVNNIALGVLLLLTLIFLGREVFAKSVLASVIYSVCFTAAFRWPVTLTTRPVLDMLIASVLIAFGYYACLSSHASTVGVDVIALIIQKYRPTVNLSRVIRTCNLIILAVGLFAFGFWPVLLGVAFAIIYSHELNWLLHRFPAPTGRNA